MHFLMGILEEAQSAFMFGVSLGLVGICVVTGIVVAMVPLLILCDWVKGKAKKENE